MAIVSVNKNKIKMLAEKGNKKARLIEGLFDDSTKFLSTIQVAITFAGFFSSASAATTRPGIGSESRMPCASCTPSAASVPRRMLKLWSATS